MKSSGWFRWSWLLGVYFFLYLPIATLIVYSFNDSKLSTLWGGFTFKWYARLFQDEEIVEAFYLSLKIAFFSATSSVLLGTLAAFALVNFRRFRGKSTFNALVNAPLVMPEVVVGLSLLLLLVSMQNMFNFPAERGALTIWIGHTVLGLSYAAVVVQSRLLDLDKSLEEAALDLGARPYQVFYLVTLPMIAPTLLAAWLLTFTLSLDDVVISAFLSGPGSNTLPIVIFSRAKLGLDPVVNVIATLTVVLVGTAVILVGLGLARHHKRKAQEQALAFQAPTALRK